MKTRTSKKLNKAMEKHPRGCSHANRTDNTKKADHPNPGS